MVQGVSGVGERWARARPVAASEAPGRDAHAVHLYVGETALLDRLESYVTEASLHGQRTVLFAEHGRLEELRLRLATWHMDAALEAHDASWALGQVLRDGMPSQELFDTLVGRTLGRYEPGTVRLYDEMVTTLWQRGAVSEALALQSMWQQYLLANPLPRLSVYARETPVRVPRPRGEQSPTASGP